VGQPVPAGLENGQQTQTQVLPLVTLTVVAFSADWPVPVTVPGSPDPVSPAVSCHGALPSSKPVFAVASRLTEPAATHTVCSAALDAAAPATATEHQPSKFITVSDTGVAPLHVAPPLLLLPLDVAPVDELPPQPLAAAHTAPST
jgi:hypothetical protein